MRAGRTSALSEKEIRAREVDASAPCSFRTGDLIGKSPQEEELRENLRSNEVRKADIETFPS